MRLSFFIRVFVYAIVAGLLGWAAYLSWGWWQAYHTGDALPPAQPITYTTDTPSERHTPPINDSRYRVAADQPRAIDIPAIHTSGFIQPVGIDRQNHMAVPTNVNFAGWYTKSALPGNPGLTIMNGHVIGQYGSAIFRNLKNLHTGDIVRIQLGNLTWLRYRVTNKISFDANNNEPLFRKSNSVASELHLVTCSGTHDKINHTYNKRLLVTAVLLDS